MGGRVTERVFPAVDAYLGIAAKYGLDPVHMAMNWTLKRPFPVVPIFGATTLEQLEVILAGIDVEVPDEAMAEIVKAHKAHPMPY